MGRAGPPPHRTPPGMLSDNGSVLLQTHIVTQVWQNINTYGYVIDCGANVHFMQCIPENVNCKMFDVHNKVLAEK